MTRLTLQKLLLLSMLFSLPIVVLAEVDAKTQALIDQMEAPARAKKAKMMKEDIVGYQLPGKPEAGQAMVYVIRPGGFGGLTKFNVYVDGKVPENEMGYNRGDQYIYFGIPAGRHTIFSQAENLAEISIEANSGESLFIKQQPGTGFLIPRNNLTFVDSVEGTYQVKHLSLGTVIRAGFEQKSAPSEKIGNSPAETTTVISSKPDSAKVEQVNSTSSVTQKLRELQQMRKEDLITEDEYEVKKKQLLDLI